MNDDSPQSLLNNQHLHIHGSLCTTEAVHHKQGNTFWRSKPSIWHQNSGTNSKEGIKNITYKTASLPSITLMALCTEGSLRTIWMGWIAMTHFLLISWWRKSKLKSKQLRGLWGLTCIVVFFFTIATNMCRFSWHTLVGLGRWRDSDSQRGFVSNRLFHTKEWFCILSFCHLISSFYTHNSHLQYYSIHVKEGTAHNKPFTLFCALFKISGFVLQLYNLVS